MEIDLGEDQALYDSLMKSGDEVRNPYD
jgi:hypothetical protein